MKKYRPLLFLLFSLFVYCGGGSVLGALISSASGQDTRVSEDFYMTTDSYQTQIEVTEDNTYKVHETIRTQFTSARHGIYRYIPMKGVNTSQNADGEEERVPYYANIKMLDSNTEYDRSAENGNAVLRFGSENETVMSGNYDFSYQLTPTFQNDSYHLAYYNVYPTGWQNTIPSGSTFSITFPKDFDHNKLVFYYGGYGEARDATAIMDLSWSGNTVSGTLKETLPVGCGVTFFARMDAGYFTGVHTSKVVPFLALIITVILFAVIGVLFLLFGRDERIYPSIQYAPPDDLDSASVGYIIDGTVENEDVISLIVYWADKGYINIEDKGHDNISLIMKKPLPKESPEYEKIVYRGIFEKAKKADNNTKKISVANLKYKFADAMSKAKTEIAAEFNGEKREKIYTTASKVARGFSTVLSIIPLVTFMFLTNSSSLVSTGFSMLSIFCLAGLLICQLIFNKSVDRWYSRSDTSRKLRAVGAIIAWIALVGVYAASYITMALRKDIFNYIWVLIFVILVSLAMSVMTAFMKKRTHQCVEWMGRLAGLRDFITNAELDRMNALVEESPQLFYHIMPYAYVFGLSDIWMKKFEGIALEPPTWYVNRSGRNVDMFDVVVFNHAMNHNLSYMNRTMSAPKPSTSGGSGGGFSGGGGGGGGFSGGGFGGGGGGSW